MTKKIIFLYSYNFFIFLALLLPTVSQGDTSKEELQLYTTEKITEDFDIIWGLALLDDNRLIFTEKSGNVNLLQLPGGKVTKLYTVPDVFTNGQGGLLDIAIPPDFPVTGWLYFTYAKSIGKDGATTLARAKYSAAGLTDWQDLLVTTPASDTGRHFGSRIAFDANGHVFFSVGDRGERPNAQNLNTHPGSILRLNMDGSVPKDNPFTASNGLPEIWSFGHRNPQGLAYDPATSRLWSNEHGPRGGDEINLILPGRNYGWPVISHGKEYWGPLDVGEATSKKGYEDPKQVYIPSIAPGSLIIYSGKAFPEWQGNIFNSALKLKHLNRITVDNQGQPVSEHRMLGDLDERIRALAVSPAGLIYFSTDSGKIYRLVPK